MGGATRDPSRDEATGGIDVPPTRFTMLVAPGTLAALTTAAYCVWC